MQITFFTSINNAYFTKAKLLSDSVKKHHPDSRFVCLLVDQPVEGWEILAPNFDELLVASEALIPEFRKWVFKHSVVEACTGVKGPALKYLLSVPGTDAVIYLDPDIYVYSPLTEVIEALEDSSVVLTPHFTEPAFTQDTIRLNEYSALQHGNFNLGFLAVANREEGKKFANWWADRLINHCFDEKNLGLFTDQKWVDLAPSYFPDLCILRQSGTNFATWNCESRRLGRDPEGNLTANAEPLRFIHFSGFDSGAHELAREQMAPNDDVFRELSLKYSESLAFSEAKWVDKQPWAYARNYAGAVIAPEWRRVFRDQPDAFVHFDDPFAIPGIQFSLSKTIDPISMLTVKFGMSIGDWVDQVAALSEETGDAYELTTNSMPYPMMVKLKHRLIGERPLICHVSHGLGGGVDIHIAELIKQSSQQCDFLLVYPVGDEELKQKFRVTYLGAKGCDTWEATWAMDPTAFALFLEMACANVVHVHHTLRAHEFFARALPLIKVNVFLTVHDHYLLTRNWSTDQLERNSKKSDSLQKWLIDEFESDQKRKLETEAILGSCSVVIFPSEFIKSNYQFCINKLETVVAPHYEEPRPEKEPVLLSKRMERGLPARRIAVLGDLGDHKGLQDIKSFATWLRESTSLLEIHHYGPVHKQLAGLVVEHGLYERKEIGSRLWSDQIDVVWLPNRAAESYSYVLSDVMRSMLPLLAYDVGAFSERVADRPLTILANGSLTSKELLDNFIAFQSMPKKENLMNEPANSDFYDRGYLELISFHPRHSETGRLDRNYFS